MLIVLKSHLMNISVLGKKKDPGIPNLYPFKDQLLRQMEEKKLKVFDNNLFVARTVNKTCLPF